MTRGEKQKPRRSAGVLDWTPPKLLDLGFLVDHVPTRHGVVLFHLKFVGHGPLVLVCSVKMTGTRR